MRLYEPLALIIHAEFAVDCRGGRATPWILILGSGYDKSPADGPGSGVSTCPGEVLPWSEGQPFSLQVVFT